MNLRHFSFSCGINIYYVQTVGLLCTKSTTIRSK